MAKGPPTLPLAEGHLLYPVGAGSDIEMESTTEEDTRDLVCASTTMVSASTLEDLQADVLRLESANQYEQAFAQKFTQLTLLLPILSPEDQVRQRRDLLLAGNAYVVRMLETPSPENLTNALRLIMRVENLLMAASSTFPKTVFWELQSIVCANSSCVHRHQRQLHCSLTIAQRGLHAELKLRRKPIGTHLNLCAILSEMHQHNRAAHHALKALQAARNLAQNEEVPTRALADETSRRPSLVQNIDASYQVPALLIAAHFSFAAQMEHTRHMEKALQHYEQARALLYALPPHASQNLTPSADDLERAIAEVISKAEAQPKQASKSTALRIFAGTKPSRPGRKVQQKVSRFQRVYHTKTVKIKPEFYPVHQNSKS